MTKSYVFSLGLFLLLVGGCAHVETRDRYKSKAQVVELKGCKAIAVLRAIEAQLFKAGFVRKATDEQTGAVASEIVESHLKNRWRMIEYLKTDYEEKKERASSPYTAIENRYKLTACEEHEGNPFLVVVRHDPETGDQFLGARFSEALTRATTMQNCEWKPVAPPRDIGFYGDTKEDDLLRFVRRGQCREYAK